MSVAVVDNHELIRDGIQNLLLSNPDRFIPRGMYADTSEVPYGEAPPDVVVLDLYLGRDDEISLPAIPNLIAWGAVVVIHTAEEQPVPLRRAVAAGVMGISLKNDGKAALATVIEQAAAGDFVCSSVLASALLTDSRLVAHLSVREAQILSSINDGLTQQQTSRRLSLGLETVKTHLKSVRTKYIGLGRDVTNTTSLLREARRDGWLD